MTNNDELAQKDLYAKVERQAHSLRGRPLEYMIMTDMCPVNVVEMLAQKIQALLEERDADKKRIAELKRDVDAANARVDTKCAQLCNQDEQIEMLSLRIAELEARTVAHDVGVMNIGNPYCEDHLVAWTVTGRQLAAGIYYLDARRVGDI